MQGHVDDLTSGGLLLGDTLESSLELGEKHEAFVQKCKSVSTDKLVNRCTCTYHANASIQWMNTAFHGQFHYFPLSTDYG